MIDLRPRPFDDPVHPPARRSISIGAKVSDVWAILAEPRHLERTHPFCAANPAHVWTDEDRRDRIDYHSGLALERTFVEWRPGSRFRLDIGTDALAPSNHVVWDLEDDEAQSTVTIAIHTIDPSDDTNANRPMLETYLDSVLAGLAHVAETGEAVRRNQFGALDFFSPAV